MDARQLQEVIEKGFKDLRAELDERFGQVDERFVKLDEKFVKVDERFVKVDERFVTLDERFSVIDTQLAGIRSELKKVGRDAHLAHVEIENLRHDLSVFDDGKPLEQRVSALEVRVTRLEKKRPAKK